MIKDFKLKGKIASPRLFKLKKNLERGKIVSPRLLKLKKDLETAKDKKKIIDEFWSAIEENGTPIIEAIERVPHHKLVTFIYKENSDTDKILLVSDGLGVIPHRWKFARLQGTDIYYKSTFYLNKTRTTYAIHKTSTSLEDIPLYPPKDNLSPLKGDPLNKKNFTILPIVTLAVLEFPDAPSQPWIEKKDNIPEGKLEAVWFKSAKFDDEFLIKIYLPTNYNPSTEPYGSLFLFHGGAYVNPDVIPTPTILDNLIFSKKIPPIIAVFIHNHFNKGMAVGRRELHTNPDFAYFVAEELLPHLKEKYNLSNNPERTIVGGLGLGGLTGSYIGLKYPHKFGKILSQSAPYWVPGSWGTGVPTRFLKIDPYFQNWQYLIGEYVKREKLPLDFYIEIGVYEAREALHGLPSHFFSNRHFRDVLLSKGYTVKYVEFIGGQDFICWRGTLADGLMYLIGNHL
jgi:enterochelin esterase family protein